MVLSCVYIFSLSLIERKYMENSDKKSSPDVSQTLDSLIIKTYTPNKDVKIPSLVEGTLKFRESLISHKIKKGDIISSETARILLSDKNPNLYAEYNRLEGGRRRPNKKRKHTRRKHQTKIRKGRNSLTKRSSKT
jgi:hypothetical protein